MTNSILCSHNFKQINWHTHVLQAGKDFYGRKILHLKTFDWINAFLNIIGLGRNDPQLLGFFECIKACFKIYEFSIARIREAAQEEILHCPDSDKSSLFRENIVFVNREILKNFYKNLDCPTKKETVTPQSSVMETTKPLSASIQQPLSAAKSPLESSGNVPSSSPTLNPSPPQVQNLETPLPSLNSFEMSENLTEQPSSPAKNPQDSIEELSANTPHASKQTSTSSKEKEPHGSNKANYGGLATKGFLLVVAMIVAVWKGRQEKSSSLPPLFDKQGKDPYSPFSNLNGTRHFPNVTFPFLLSNDTDITAPYNNPKWICSDYLCSTTSSLYENKTFPTFEQGGSLPHKKEETLSPTSKDLAPELDVFDADASPLVNESFSKTENKTFPTFEQGGLLPYEKEETLSPTSKDLAPELEPLDMDKLPLEETTPSPSYQKASEANLRPSETCPRKTGFVVSEIKIRKEGPFVKDKPQNPTQEGILSFNKVCLVSLVGIITSFVCSCCFGKKAREKREEETMAMASPTPSPCKSFIKAKSPSLPTIATLAPNVNSKTTSLLLQNDDDPNQVMLPPKIIHNHFVNNTDDDTHEAILMPTSNPLAGKNRKELTDFNRGKILQEHLRVLQEEHNINASNAMKTIKQWRKNSKWKNSQMLKNLERTFCNLITPPKHLEAKAQYENFLNALRATITSNEYQSIQENRADKIERECLNFVRTLCLIRPTPKVLPFFKNLTDYFLEASRTKDDGKNSGEITYKNFADQILSKMQKINNAPKRMTLKNDVGIMSPLKDVELNYTKFIGAAGLQDFPAASPANLHSKQIFVCNGAQARQEKRINYYRMPTPHYQNDLPSSSSSSSFQKTVNIGTTLYRIGMNTAKRKMGFKDQSTGERVVPEFIEMVKALKAKGEEFLYCCHQRLNDKEPMNEHWRVKTLMDVDKTQDNFHLLIQAVEGDLFERKKNFQTITTFVGLKKALIDSFYEGDDKAHNALPRALKQDKNYKENVLPHLLNKIHEIFFKNKEEINFNGKVPGDSEKPYPEREWQMFILIFYIFQAMDLKMRLPNISHFSSPCKDFLDRGGNRAMTEALILAYMMAYKKRKGRPSREELEPIMYNLLAPPIVAKGIAPIKHRLEPGLAVAQHLASLSDEQLKALCSMDLFVNDNHEMKWHLEEMTFQ